MFGLRWMVSRAWLVGLSLVGEVASMWVRAIV